jgi:hypothetical protein
MKKSSFGDKPNPTNPEKFEAGDLEDVEIQEAEETNISVIEGGKVEKWEPIRVRAYVAHSITLVWVLLHVVASVGFVINQRWELLAAGTI